MNTSLIKTGYHTRSIASVRNEVKSSKIITEEAHYYKVIGTVLFIITGLSIAATYLMPTVPL